MWNTSLGLRKYLCPHDMPDTLYSVDVTVTGLSGDSDWTYGITQPVSTMGVIMVLVIRGWALPRAMKQVQATSVAQIAAVIAVR